MRLRNRCLRDARKCRPLPRARTLLALAILAAGFLLPACEGPNLNMDRTDSSTYSLIAQRQRQALGANADSAILPAEYPPTTPEMLNKTPPTFNQLPGAPADATAPAATATVPAPATAASRPSADELLKNIPGIEIDKMPELPTFPKPPANGKTRRTLNLDDAFNVALADNREYMSRKEDLYLTALNVALQRHAFEPQFFASTTVGIAGNGEASDYAAAFNATQTVGLRQRLPLGGQIIAQALAGTVRDVRQSVASENTDLSLRASIPLLRGAGSVAQEDLISAERNLVYEVRDFERYRRGFLVTIATQYFNLVNQRAQIVNRFSSVRSYIFITQRSRALFDAGLTKRRTTLLDVMRAAQSEYQARSQLISAIEQYEIALDRFKILLGIDVEDPIDVTPQYLTIAPPALSESAAVDIALQLRLDLQTTRDQVDDARRGVKNANNNMLPDLNLNANVGAGSNPRSFEPRVDNLNYGTSLTLDWPLDRVAEKTVLRTAQVNLERAKRNVDTAESQVTSDVRSAIRAVRQQQVVLAIQKSNIDLAQKRKAFSDIQFRDGKIDNRDYLDAETALLDAQNSFARALSDLEVSVLQYLRDTDQLRVDFSGRLQLPSDPHVDPATTPAPTTAPAAPTPTAAPAAPAPNPENTPNPPPAPQ
jgi:outer membrane protein TolC